MAELAAIGWVVSPMIKKMTEKIPSYIMGQYHWQRDMKMDLEKLGESLLQIQVVVDKAEGWHALKDSQKQLLQRLKDAVYEADDLLDEFEYRVMQTQAEKAQGMVSRTASSSLRFAKRLGGRDKLRTRLTEIVQKLDRINKSAADRLMQVAGSERTAVVEQHEISSGRVTSSILTESKIFGREREKDEIVSSLLKTDYELESSYTNFTVIPIIGDGGIGKTTLAQLIYNDERIKDRFHLRMWICVSDNFDKVQLTREMLECVSEPNERHEGTTNFDMLQKKLQTKLESRRFLLVLDDVWPNEEKGDSWNEEMWRKLLAPLQDGARDSKILVTARLEIVAKIFGVTNLISLEGLTKDETWSLLQKCAFGDENPINYAELKEVGMRIAERLKGSPLASKVVGSMLRDRPDVMKWKEILEGEISDDVMSVLRLSYQHLPDHLKPCFAYCSIFPKDWRFEPEKLVMFWIAHGYIRPSIRNKKPMVDVGMDYFNELLSRSFFQKVEQDFNIYYIIHDLIHDLAQYISKDECFRIDAGQQWNSMPSIRHLGVAIYDVGEFAGLIAELEKRCDLRKLRTLIFFRLGWRFCMDLPPGMLRRLRSLRVLDLSVLSMDNFPEALGHLLHLRYLNLGGHWFPILPESFFELYHLEVLVASGLCFCKSMGKLISFGKLACLQLRELKFSVGKKRGYRIGVLKDINVVFRGKLCLLNLEGVGSIEEAVEVELRRKQHIDGLHLEWGHSGEGSGSNNLVVDVGVLEGLQPHPNLRELEIKGFRGTRCCPSWIETSCLTNLQIICLIDCRCLEVLPPLGHLPSLERLEIKKMNAVKRVGSEFYGVDVSGGVRGFPSLEVLEFADTPEWSEWCGVDDQSGQVLWMLGNPPAIFPRLRQLRVSNCPKLMSFPLFPPTLRDVGISGTGLIHHLELGSLSPSSSSEGLFLNTSLIPSRALQHDQLLGAIERLTIRSCEEPMPAGGLLGLVCLKELHIRSCQELLAFEIPEEEEDGTGVLPPSLELLEIYHCRVTDRWLSRCLHGLASLKHLTLHSCPGLKSSPEDGLPASIEELEFLGCGVPKESLIRCLQGLPSLSFLRLDVWIDLTSLLSLRHLRMRSWFSEENSELVLPQSLESLEIQCLGVSDRLLSRCLQGLTHLSGLTILEVADIMSSPSAQVLHRLTSLGGLHAIDSLKRLELLGCTKVESLPEEGLPVSIEHLHLWKCHPTLHQQIWEKKGPEWDKVAHIPRIDID